MPATLRIPSGLQQRYPWGALGAPFLWSQIVSSSMIRVYRNSPHNRSPYHQNSVSEILDLDHPK
ncbi:uncharacterized protein EAF01_009855 [Botrytis porri]|uniref:uncharacterized protein n=1 Tax=Botrytis porri TaxID=87229 RepID=UPI001900554C|nr:uncharacterized protein EAF01_009855 [Botrytis porri]KAF7894404.1 hypothetical protein EAF01_009855 [Botrytis porri]